MTERAAEPLDAALRRLKAERAAADRRYHDALTALDRSLRPPPDLPQPPVPLDDTQITPLNDAWNILPSEPRGSGVSGRLVGLVWRTIGPYLQRQLTFNSLVVDHINRNAAAAREAHRAVEATTTLVRRQLAALAEFQTLLIVYLQQITLYVDTKDRDTAGGALILNAAIAGVGEELAKRWESLMTREERCEARTAALSAAHDELRAMISITQQASLALKRELERLRPPIHAEQQAPRTGTARRGSGGPRKPAEEHRPGGAFARALDAYKYVGFEDQFRGSQEAIRERMESYLPFFATDGHGRTTATDEHRPIPATDGSTQIVGDVLDVGCGRGEFLDLLKARGIAARGIDLNHEMAEVCRARGLDVTEADAVGYLSDQPDASFAGIFAAQVVEHLDPGYLLQFLELAFHKLRPGGRLVLETLNPACWVAFFESYIRDITHVWPLHPETLKYLVIASGFSRVAVEFRSPVPPQDRLQPVVLPPNPDPALVEVAEAFNANVEKLNARIFTYLDYAIVATRM
jgi:SAM-dependent methyltransferase